MQREKERMISFGEEIHSHSRIVHLLHSLRRKGEERMEGGRREKKKKKRKRRRRRREQKNRQEMR